MAESQSPQGEPPPGEVTDNPFGEGMDNMLNKGKELSKKGLSKGTDLLKNHLPGNSSIPGGSEKPTGVKEGIKEGVKDATKRATTAAKKAIHEGLKAAGHAIITALQPFLAMMAPYIAAIFAGFFIGALIIALFTTLSFTDNRDVDTNNIKAIQEALQSGNGNITNFVKIAGNNDTRLLL